MNEADYQEVLNHINCVLDSKQNKIVDSPLPSTEECSFGTIYNSWISCIAIDIGQLLKLYKKDNIIEFANIIQSFAFEVIGIFKAANGLREYHLDDNYLYAIYSVPTKKDIYYVANAIFYINTFTKLLNKVLAAKDLNTISIGIGMASAKENALALGDINLWLGKSKDRACQLAAIALNDNNNKLAFDKNSYGNFIELMVKNNLGKDPKDWFELCSIENGFEYYKTDIVKTKFDTWIKNLDVESIQRR